MKETFPTKRLVRTLVARERAGSGRTAAKRKNITTSGSSVSIPDKINEVVIKNVGANAMAFNFNADRSSDFWSLEPGETSPVIVLGEGVTLNAITPSGTTTMECLFWG